MFHTAHALWREYEVHYVGQLDRRQAMASADAGRRLDELTWLLHQVEMTVDDHAHVIDRLWLRAEEVRFEFESRYGDPQSFSAPDLDAELNDVITRLQVFGEYFYWSTNRVAKNFSQLPGMRRFKGKTNAERIRHKVIEHSDRIDDQHLRQRKFVSQAPYRTMLTHETEWITFGEHPETVGASSETRDEGLRLNALEFRDEVEKRLVEALTAVGVVTSSSV